MLTFLTDTTLDDDGLVEECFGCGAENLKLFDDMSGDFPFKVEKVFSWNNTNLLLEWI